MGDFRNSVGIADGLAVVHSALLVVLPVIAADVMGLRAIFKAVVEITAFAAFFVFIVQNFYQVTVAVVTLLASTKFSF